jgi:hypothetical protein
VYSQTHSSRQVEKDSLQTSIRPGSPQNQDPLIIQDTLPFLHSRADSNRQTDKDTLQVSNRPDSSTNQDASIISDSFSSEIIRRIRSCAHATVIAVNSHADSLRIQDKAERAALNKRVDSLREKVDSLQKSTAVMQSGREEIFPYYYDRVALGYEEGISFRLRLYRMKQPARKALALTGGAGYQLSQQSDMVHRRLYEAHVKIGLFQEFGVSKRMRVAGYIDAMEKKKQMEIAPLKGQLLMGQIRYNRYTLWITKVRAGILLNLFCLDHFLLTYRFGVEFDYCTPPYVPDPTNMYLMRFGKGIYRFGLSGSDISALDVLINNIGIYVYF